MLSSWFCDIFVYSFFDKYLFSPDIENRVISWVKFADDKKVGVFEYHTFPLCASLQDDDDDVYNGDYYVDAVAHVLEPMHFISWIEAKYKPSTHQELCYLNFDLTKWVQEKNCQNC